VLGEENKAVTVVQLYGFEVMLFNCDSRRILKLCQYSAGILYTVYCIMHLNCEQLTDVCRSHQTAFVVMKVSRSEGVPTLQSALQHRVLRIISPYLVKKGQSTNYQIYTKSKKGDTFYTCHIL